MRTRYSLPGFLCMLLLVGGAASIQAKDLVGQLEGLYPGGLTLVPAIPGHEAHFRSQSLARLGTLTQQLAPSASDFPVISTTPGFTFHYNSQIQAFERSSSSLGPVYVERAQTIGQGKFDVGMSYLYVDFDELNGKSLKGLNFTLGHEDCCDPNTGVETGPGTPPTPNNPLFEKDSIKLTFNRFSLRSHVMSFFATYGITDRWDVNILLPVVYTSFKVRLHAHIDNSGSQEEFAGTPLASGIHFFDANGRIDDFRGFDKNKTGVGDIQLRTKYHLFASEGFNLASGLALRIPSGENGNFQGLGDTTLTPFVALSQEYGPVEFHANGGIQINFNDSDRSRVRYAGGVTFRLIEEVALLVDVIGSSNLKTDRFSVKVPVDEATPSGVVPGRLHTDVVDLNVGFKTSPFGPQRAVIGFATVFVPLNHDGLRSDAIPAVGLEVGF